MQPFDCSSESFDLISCKFRPVCTSICSPMAGRHGGLVSWTGRAARASGARKWSAYRTCTCTAVQQVVGYSGAADQLRTRV